MPESAIYHYGTEVLTSAIYVRKGLKLSFHLS